MSDTGVLAEIRQIPNPDALAISRQVAAYYIGDPSWADMIVNAYLNPQAALRNLTEDMDA